MPIPKPETIDILPWLNPQSIRVETTDHPFVQIVPKGELWVLTEAYVTNDKRAARGRLFVAESREFATVTHDFGTVGPVAPAFAANWASDCLQGWTRPVVVNPGGYFDLDDDAHVALDSHIYSVRYYVVVNV